MSFGRMGEAEQKLKDEIDALLNRAAAEDAAQDEELGKGRSGDDLPAELARWKSRLAKLQEAKRALEEEESCLRGPDEAEAGERGRTRRVPHAQGHRGASVRADQGVARVPVIFVAWAGHRSRRVEAGLPDP
jgi:hypothetical protein